MWRVCVLCKPANLAVCQYNYVGLSSCSRRGNVGSSSLGIDRSAQLVDLVYRRCVRRARVPSVVARYCRRGARLYHAHTQTDTDAARSNRVRHADNDTQTDRRTDERTHGSKWERALRIISLFSRRQAQYCSSHHTYTIHAYPVCPRLLIAWIPPTHGASDDFNSYQPASASYSYIDTIDKCIQPLFVLTCW